jgi:hypothetical protein
MTAAVGTRKPPIMKPIQFVYFAILALPLERGQSPPMTTQAVWTYTWITNLLLIGAGKRWHWLNTTAVAGHATPATVLYP